MVDAKSVTKVSKGVERGHILCCCAVVFVCFMLTCLNLYMLSSTRAVLRHLDSRLDAHPRFGALQRQQVQQSPEEAAAAAAALLLQQQPMQLQQAEGADDFILLAPSDLDNAWTTQTGRLLVPVGQPEEDDDGWKQMQVQLAEQSKAQQQHIENLHDKLNDQYRAREELQRDQQDLLREHHELAMQHQRQMAKKDRKLLKEKHRAMHQGAKHKDQLRRYQSEMEDLKKVVEEVQSLDPARAAEPAPTAATAVKAPADSISVDAVVTTLEQKNGGEPVVNKTETVMQMAVPVEAETEPSSSLEHIFSAVFGPNPGTYFFPSYTVGADEVEKSSRAKRDLADVAADMKDRRERRLARLASRSSRFGSRRRRHNQADSGPLMRIDDGQLVPLVETPVVRDDGQGARRRRLAKHRG
ncbi:uncharacterized protein LOC117644790 [Thrips palmi]|uniref:Uncharacterized protein LOC117644790 n=1 Tax=Thrips palmi TaxID=161013 RepID=A0A6P8YSE6_THRPL|nr:uncharacterized protein LOC117644790 [Thrips palmi]